MIVVRVAVEPDTVGEDQPAAAPDPPDVVEARFAHRLAHGRAAEHDRLDREQPAGLVDLGGQAPGQAERSKTIVSWGSQSSRPPARP